MAKWIPILLNTTLKLFKKGFIITSYNLDHYRISSTFGNLVTSPQEIRQPFLHQ
jgi:hypothetical protein